MIFSFFNFIRWIGLTSYSYEKNKAATECLFKRQKQRKIKKICFALIIYYVGIRLTTCYFRITNNSLVLLEAAQYLHSLNTCLLFTIMNLKEQQIIQIILDLLQFEGNINEALGTIVDVSKGSLAMQIYNLMQTLNFSMFFAMFFHLIISGKMTDIGCWIKSLIFWVEVYGGEGFLFYLVTIVTNVMIQFKNNLKKVCNSKISVTDIEKIYYKYFHIKNQIENVFEFYLFGKIMYSICTFAFGIYATIYVYREMTRTAWNSILLIIYSYWMFQTLFGTITLIYPFATFYQAVSKFLSFLVLIYLQLCLLS